MLSIKLHLLTLLHLVTLFYFIHYFIHLRAFVLGVQISFRRLQKTAPLINYS